MTLEDLLREAAAKGLTHLTLYPVPSADNKTTYWNARATPSTGHSYVQTANYDPVVAVTTVLEALPRAKKRADPPPRDPPVTAAVSDAQNEASVQDSSEAFLADEWARYKT